MRDYWLTQDILRASGFGFIALALLGIGLALWLPKTRAGKTWALVVVGILIAIPMSQVVRGVMEAREFEARSDKAKAMWQERCKTAGEKIHRTVEGVEGIYLMKVRPEGINYGEQFKLDDPYGSDLGGDGYIETLVRGSYQASHKVRSVDGPPRFGFSYVEAQDPKDGQRYRYTGRVEEPWKTNKAYSVGYQRFVLDKAPARDSAPRYGVTYDDISTQEEREYWIAGSSLKVIDLQTKEVIAERIGYMVDLAQGSRAGQRSPWLFAANNACPDFYRNYKNLVVASDSHRSGGQPYQTLDFVEKVLNPSK